MQPKLLKTERLAVTASRKLLHELACTYVEEKFQLTGSTEPTWLIAHSNLMAWFETPWENGDQKRYVVNAFRRFFYNLDVDCYSSIVEAWAFNSEIVPKDEKGKWLEIIKEEGLTNIPDRYKDDIVMITTFDKSDDYSLTQYKVTPRARGKGLSFLGPRLDNPHGVEKFSGRMWNLLQPESAMDWPIKH